MLDGPRRQERSAQPARPRRLRHATFLLACLVATRLLAAQSPASNQPPTRNPPPIPDGSALEQQITRLLAAPAVARAHWGIAVSALDGRPLLALDASRFFHPASNAKLFTTAAAMALLGPDTTVTTQIDARGPLVNGTLTGDLALVGAGDADFATDDIPYRPPVHPAASPLPAEPTPPPQPLHALERMADAVAAAGLRTITGDIIGDDTHFVWEPYPEDWAQDDLLWGYGAPVSALSVHDNQVALHIRPGSEAGVPAVAEFEPGMPPWFTLDTAGLTTGPARSGTHVGIGPVPGDPRALRVWGTIAAPAPAPAPAPATAANAAPADAAPDDVEQIALPEPALFAAEALRALLLARGITVTGIARAQHRLPIATAGLREQTHQPLAPVAAPLTPSSTSKEVLATTISPTLVADETATNKLSLNLHAELLLERLGERFGAQPPSTPAADPASRAQGIRVLRSILPLAGIDPDDIVLVDGSGLSTHDLVTPRAVVGLLTWASTQPWFAAWRTTLPIGGTDGSLAGRFLKPPLTGQIRAKTGTLGEARALSGYLTCRSGRTVAFSILDDNHTPGSTADRDTTDHILAALYAAL